MHQSRIPKLLFAFVLLATLAGRAEAQLPSMPAAFLGEWAVSPDHCYLPHKANLVITQDWLAFRPMPSRLIALRPTSDLQVEVGLSAADGRSQESRRFELSGDSRQLMDVTDRSNPVTRIRCDMARQRVIGLLEIPALHGALNSGTPQSETSSVTLHVEPDRDSVEAATVHDRTQLVSREHGSEQESAAVFAQARDTSTGGRWYLLGYAVGEKTGYGWLDAATTGTFRDVHTLIRQGLSYMTDNWDRRLHARPEPGSASRAVEGMEPRVQPAAHVISTWRDRAKSEDWYLVALVRNQCSGEPLEVISTGWVTAYAPDGGNNVWYYSRGC